MHLVRASSSEAPPIAGQPKAVGKLTRMKLYLLVAVIAVAALASGFGLMFLSSRSYTVAIRSAPTGSGFVVVDGNPVTTPCNFSWVSGSSHNITASNEASSSQVQYAYSSWSDGGVQSHTITVNGTADYTANFVTLMPLTYSYVPGEEMTYSMKFNESSTAPSWNGMTTSGTENITISVVSFDGEYYKINETSAISSNIGSINMTVFNQSFILEVNKTGYIKSFNGSSLLGQELSSFVGSFITAFEKNESRAGETWQIPLSSLFPSNSSIALGGNLTETFGDLQNFTVPAGTFRVFSIDVSANNVTMVVNLPAPANTSISENITFSGREYLEYGTNRLIDMEMQMNYVILQNNQIYVEDMSEQIELVKYVVPQ